MLGGNGRNRTTRGTCKRTERPRWSRNPPYHHVTSESLTIFQLQSLHGWDHDTPEVKDRPANEGPELFFFLGCCKFTAGVSIVFGHACKIVPEKIDGLFETRLTVNLGGVSGVDMWMEVICRCSS